MWRDLLIECACGTRTAYVYFARVGVAETVVCPCGRRHLMPGFAWTFATLTAPYLRKQIKLWVTGCDAQIGNREQPDVPLGTLAA